jgi:tetratricopeptide (TPR) repeat protein
MKTVPTTTRYSSAKAFCAFLSIVLLTAAATNVSGQKRGAVTDDEIAAHRAVQTAISTAERGSPDQALAAMKDAVDHNKTNATVWYYYGFALSRTGDLEGATKAFKETLKLDSKFLQARFRLARALLLASHLVEAEQEARRALGPDAKDADAHYVYGEIHLLCGDAGGALAEAETSLRSNSSFPLTFLLQSQAKLLALTAPGSFRPANREQVRQTLNEALASMERFFALAGPKSNDVFLRDQLESLRFYAKAAEEESAKPDRLLYFPNEATTRAHVFSRGEALYTESARAFRVQGGVMLCVVLSADGSVEHLLVLRSLPLGLTGTSLEAAKQTKFTPATKDGHPVPQLTQLEYNFNLY